MERLMRKSLRISMAFGVCLAAGWLSGCMGRNLVTPPPDWFRLQTGLYDIGGAKVFYGIGQVVDVQNLMLARATADNRARDQLAGVLVNYVHELARSAALNPDPGWSELTDDERRQILGLVVRDCLQHAVFSDHWNDAQKPGLLALCRLDLTTFKQVLDNSSDLDEAMRAAMLAQADSLHDRLAQKF
jgi:hypothetical protein